MKKILALGLMILVTALIYIAASSAASLKERWSSYENAPRTNIGSDSTHAIPEKNRELNVSQVLPQCVLGASSSYRVPTDVMIGIMSVEGGRSGQEVGPNLNGTYDLGIMQVNSLWIPKLAQLWGVDYRTAYNAVRDSGCENIYVGAWILKRSIVETGTLYGGVAYYHSATRGLGSAYANKVVGAMNKRSSISTINLRSKKDMNSRSNKDRN